MVSLKFVLLNRLRIHSLPKGKVTMGKHNEGAPFIFSLWKDNEVTIGDYCSFGPDVILIAQMGHILPKEYSNYYVSTFPLFRLKRNSFKPEYYHPQKENDGILRIGNDVWMGARVIINPGIKVGDGAIIGSGSVVTHNVEPYSVVVGCPAKLIRYRYDQTQISKLLKIAWWNWDEKKIIENLDFLYGDVNKFIEKFSK
jgi:acetyltransferase-like isoleucine patch superfamily enzyme